MASEKLMRDNAAAGEEKVHVERDRVPKMATHFESLAVKDPATPSGVTVEGESGPGGVREEIESSDERKEEAELLRGVGKFEGDFGEGGKGGGKGFSNEEVSGYRQQAQQGSIDALRAAEERYNQAKATTTSTLQSFKDTVLEKGTQAKDSVLGKEAGRAHTTTEGQKALEKGTHDKDSILGKGTEGAHKAAESVGQKSGGIKDTALEKGTQAKDTLAEAAQRTAQYVGEKGGVVKDTALEKGTQARASLAQGAQTTAQYAAEKGQVAKEGTATAAGKAKDAVVSVAVGAADRAAAAGWAAAEYATDLTVEGTKKAADVVKGVAGYAGEKVGVVKDKVVETEESVRDYAARKKEEAKRDLEAKKMGQQKEGMGEQGTQGGEKSMVEEVVQKPKETFGEFIQGGEQQQQDKGHEGGESGGVFQAIGETIVEIAHTTKDLVIGQDEIENQGEKTTTMMGQNTQKSDHLKQ